MKTNFIGLMTFLMFTSIQSNATSGFTEEGIYSLCNQTLGYQLGYSNSSKHLFQTVDFGGSIVFMNYGYQYHFSQGSKMFIGIGVAMLFQLQYGYAFDVQSNLLRIRSDWEIDRVISLFKSKKEKLKYPISTVGLFYEKGFNGDYKGYTIGVTVALSVWDVKYYSKKMMNKK